MTGWQKLSRNSASGTAFALLPDLSTDILRKFREAWTLAPRTAGKQLEHLRQIFKFAVESGWLSVNPAKPIKVPKVRVNPRIPFEEEDVQKLLSPEGEAMQIQSGEECLPYFSGK